MRAEGGGGTVCGGTVGALAGWQKDGVMLVMDLNQLALLGLYYSHWIKYIRLKVLIPSVIREVCIIMLESVEDGALIAIGFYINNTKERECQS